MGRFRIQGNNFLFASNTRGEIVAFTTPLRGRALVEAILGYAIYPDISGWSPDEIVNELAASGIISRSDLLNAPTQPASLPSSQVFRVIKTGKNGVWWEHTPTGTAKYFDQRLMNHRSAEWSDDRWHGKKSGGWDRMSYRQWTEADVATDYATSPASWRKYRKEYNHAFREDSIIFE